MSFRKIPSIALIIGAFMVLLLIVNHPSSAAENSLDEPDKIYVSDLGARTMLRMGMDGTQVETLFELPEETGPLAVVLDPARERMYYIDRQREYRHIYSADMEGQDRQELPVPFGHYNTLALDHGSSRLLWTQIEAIGESDFDGADAAFQLHPGPVDPGDIVVDEVNDLLYWSGQKSGIFSSHFDGSSTVVIKDNEWLTTITVDAPAGELYYAFSLSHGYVIKRVNLISDEIKAIIPYHEGTVGSLAIDLTQGKIYWSATHNSGQIMRANLDGTAEETLITGLAGPAGISLDEANQRIYWADWVAKKIQNAPMDGGLVVDLIDTAPQKPRDVVVDSQAGQIFWTGEYGAAVSRADLDGKGAAPLIDYAQSASRGIGLDGRNGRLYWSDGRQEAVFSANVDGSGLTTLLIQRLENGAGLAFDPLDNKIYWADISLDIIARANRNGTGYEELVTSGLELTTSVAVDPLRGKLYWADQERHHIARANLDGSGVAVLLAAADGLEQPNMVTLDVSKGKLYWTDWGNGTLKRANLDGTAVEILHGGMDIPSGIALDQPAAQYSRQFIPLAIAVGNN